MSKEGIELGKLKAMAGALNTAEVHKVPGLDMVETIATLNGQRVNDLESCTPYKGLTNPQAEKLGAQQAKTFTDSQGLSQNSNLARAMSDVVKKKRDVCGPR